MQFRAAIKDQTLIHRVWSGERRSIGVVDGVQFRRAGLRYVSVDDPLPAAAVAVLSRNPQVQLELSSLPVGVEDQAFDSGEQQEPKAEPEPAEPVAAQPAPATPTQQRSAKVDLRAQKGWNGGKNR